MGCSSKIVKLVYTNFLQLKLVRKDLKVNTDEYEADSEHMLKQERCTVSKGI